MLSRILVFMFVANLFPGLLAVAEEKDKVVSKRAAEAANADWQMLFAKERWYKNQKGKEVVFRGKLESVPNAGAPSTLQRTTYYRLGKRTIYTGAKRVPALDRLVGQQVEIRGKAVDFKLEGQSVREIWPAAVRAVVKADDAAADPPVIKKITGFTPLRAGRRLGFRRTKPTIIKTSEKLTEIFGKNEAGKISKQADFQAQFLVFFQWAGSSQDKLTHQVETQDEKSRVVFSFKPGRTRDLRPRSHLCAIRKGSVWEVAE